MADDILPKGIRLFNKKDTQPDFVVGAMVITMNDLFQFCKDNPALITEYNGAKQLKLQILKSQNGNLYAKVDTWKPEGQTAGALPAAKPLPEDDNSLPF